ncbi:DUF1638 domain-containing protein [Clostridium ljungdahlii]|uniref:DUF1638 domain-containing protein n=1 Tax=Clostridium ljungdahlii TaxID=1538 RepID=A0A166QZ87_9CLOT|nr:DUF1638 domain-containing protein [Clostridium ljungdahlii]OAA90513.1 hypothetical protein WY13_01417 [Clostridium ljungdahlii]
MKIKIIACEVMKEEILSIEPLPNEEFGFVTMGYHLHPKKLAKELQEIIDKSLGYDRVILAFGLCGGAARGLKATNCALTIPRVHDCISIFLSSDKGCVCDFKKEMGTLYLSRGWMITEKSILSDHQRVLEKYGEKKALSILNRMYGDYKKVLFIGTGSLLQDEVMLQSKQIAKLINASYEIVEEKTHFIERIIRGPWDDKNFINIDKQEILTEEDFGINAK